MLPGLDETRLGKEARLFLAHTLQFLAEQERKESPGAPPILVTMEMAQAACKVTSPIPEPPLTDEERRRLEILCNLAVGFAKATFVHPEWPWPDECWKALGGLEFLLGQVRAGRAHD